MRQLNVAYGSSRHSSRWVNKTISWDDLLSRFENTIYTTESTDEYPRLPKAERDSIKDKGGFIGGYLKDGRRSSKTVVSRSIAVLDGDQVDPMFIDRFRKDHLFAAFLYTTHSHTPERPRVRIGFPLTRDVNPDEYVAIVRYLADYFGIEGFDECSYRVNQLMYWPTTPADGQYVFVPCDGEWLDPDAFLEQHPDWRDCSTLPHSSREKTVHAPGNGKANDPRTKTGTVGAFCRAYCIQDAIECFLADVYEPSSVDDRYSYIPADSTAGLVIYDDGTFAYSNHATDPAFGKNLNAFDLVRIHRFSHLDEGTDPDTQTISLPSTKAMLEFATGDERVRKLLLQERQQQAQQEFEPLSDDGTDDEWKNRLQYEPRSGKVANTLQNAILIMQNDAGLQAIVFNELADGLEIKGEVPWNHPAKFWRDADDAQLVSYIDANYGSFSARNYDIAVTKVADDRSYHPIREYFDTLPDWDGECRVDTLLVDYLGAEDNAYTRAVTRKTLCAAVARVLNPGIKFDTMLVLSGPQGVGKSTLIAKLAGEWFSDSLSLNDTKDKTAAEKLQGYWILEIGELAGLRKAEVETLRSFLSRQNDIFRASFGRRATPHQRQCIFFGTTNAETGYLRDTTGNRRFWPVHTPGTGKKHSWELDDETIAQIWAEVRYDVAQGEKLYLPPEIEQLAFEEQRAALESDEREGIIVDYLERLLPEGWENMDLGTRRAFLNGTDFGPAYTEGTVPRKQVSTLEIWCECLNKDRSSFRRSDSNEITAILTRIGWTRLPEKQRLMLYGPQYCFAPKTDPEICS